MRSRDMMTKLDRLPKRGEEVKVPDSSLLAPAEQDRANELLHLICRIDDTDSDEYQALSTEFWSLIEGLPWLGPNDPDQGPTIEVPHDLESYWIWSQTASEWRHYNFSALSKVQTLRFVDLCRKYGYDEEGGPLKKMITPLVSWKGADRAELGGMLDVAAGAEKALNSGTDGGFRRLNRRS